MTQDDFDAHLSDLFREADAVFEQDGEPFAASVVRRVKSRTRMRRLILSFFALIGGAITAFQLPAAFELLDGYVGFEGQITPVLASLQDGLKSDQPNLDIKWIAAIVVGVGTFFVTMTAGDA
ncbi:MAG: hypothetical protein AAFS13_06945 [Pseudomonadota bacterium]